MPRGAKTIGLLLLLASAASTGAQPIERVAAQSPRRVDVSARHEIPAKDVLLQPAEVAPAGRAATPHFQRSPQATAQAPPQANSSPHSRTSDTRFLAPATQRPSTKLEARPDLSAPSRRQARKRTTSAWPSLASAGGSLAVVVGLFLLVIWVTKRRSPQAGGALPKEAFERLGHAPLSNRQHVHLLRCGNKLLLVSVTATGAETLTEISDPAEVDRLHGICAAAAPGSATSTFRQLLSQLGREKTEQGFIDNHEGRKTHDE